VITGGRGSLIRMGLLALFWGSSFLWIKLALHGLSPMQITLGRLVWGAGLVLVLCLITRERLPGDRRVWGHLVVAAIFGNVLPFTLFGLGERTVDSGVAGVLNATTPLWALLIGIMIGTERRLSAVRVGGLLLGFGGTLLIFAPWHAAGLASWGALAILGAAFSYGICFAYIGTFLAGRGGTPMALSAAQLLTATGLTVLTIPVAGLQTVHLQPLALVAVSLLGIFGTGLAYVLNYRLIEDEGPTNASTVGYLLPVVSVVLGAIFLSEQLTVRVVAGMIVVLIGVGMTRWKRRGPRPLRPAGGRGEEPTPNPLDKPAVGGPAGELVPVGELGLAKDA
jgi:drug/metabolite transporter (DMT)-like permease